MNELIRLTGADVFNEVSFFLYDALLALDSSSKRFELLHSHTSYKQTYNTHAPES